MGDLDDTAAGSAQRAQEILKAHVFEERPAPNGSQAVDEAERVFGFAGAIEPPYNPRTLTTLLELSSSLRQNIDSYVTNIDAFGHRFEPVIDLDSADSDQKIADYIFQRRNAENPVIADPTAQAPQPTEEEIASAKEELTERMRIEKARVKAFFDFACLDISFATLRRRTRQDLETTGNAYWEVIRNEAGRIVQFDYVPSYTMRLLPTDTTPVRTRMKVKVSEFSYDTIDVQRRFRRFVQVFESQCVYFKEFGDRRVISRKTGAVCASVEELRARDAADGPATEILHFKIHSAQSSYGVPRWVGTLLPVLGSRQAEEVNYAYFDNKSVPPLAMLVSGGRITESTVSRIQSFVDGEIRGKKNFHKILVLEAEPAQGGQEFGNAGRMKIELKPLTDAQHGDALFQRYDERNIDKVGQAFRLPRMLRGDIRDFNRATAEAALEFAETQVFGPERDEFDFVVNRKILPELGVRFWTFRSNAPVTRNAKDLTEMIVSLTDKGVLTPAEARDLAEGVFNRELRKIDAPWVRQPMSLTAAGIAPPEELAAPGMAAPDGSPLPAPTLPSGEGSPLGGALPPTAPASATPGPRQGGGELRLTGTDLATIVTVNEARAEQGLGPLRSRDGAEDPDGFLTVAEFRAKRTARGEEVGTAQGRSVGGPPPEETIPGMAPKRDSEALRQALSLLAMRKQLKAAEAAEAELEFLAAKGAVSDDEAED